MLSGLKIQDQISTLAIHSDVTYTDLKLLNLGLITELMTKFKKLFKIN